jgi:hypothetical protein
MNLCRSVFAGSSASAASFGVWTDINGELAELSTDDFTCVLQGSNPPEVCVEERGGAGDHGVDPKGSRSGAHWAAVDAIRAEPCLWVPLRAYGGTACMIVTGSLAG